MNGKVQGLHKTGFAPFCFFSLQETKCLRRQDLGQLPECHLCRCSLAEKMEKEMMPLLSPAVQNQTYKPQ